MRLLRSGGWRQPMGTSSFLAPDPRSCNCRYWNLHAAVDGDGAPPNRLRPQLVRLSVVGSVLVVQLAVARNRQSQKSMREKVAVCRSPSFSSWLHSWPAPETANGCSICSSLRRRTQWRWTGKPKLLLGPFVTDIPDTRHGARLLVVDGCRLLPPSHYS